MRKPRTKPSSSTSDIPWEPVSEAKVRRVYDELKTPECPEPSARQVQEKTGGSMREVNGYLQVIRGVIYVRNDPIVLYGDRTETSGLTDEEGIALPDAKPFRRPKDPSR